MFFRHRHHYRLLRTELTGDGGLVYQSFICRCGKVRVTIDNIDAYLERLYNGGDNGSA